MSELVLMWHTLTGQSQSYRLTTRPTLIGRSADQCDVVIDAPTVSRRHASIYAEGGTFYLRNESATNVVHFNRQYRLTQYQTVPIRAGDSFRVGPVHIQIAAQAMQPRAGTPKIKCHRCGNICDYDPEQFCPHCGEALAAGQTVFMAG